MKKRSFHEMGAANNQISYIEFYCGVGGWTMALEEAVQNTFDSEISLHCCAALDHSDLCMQVYHHNHTLQNKKAYRIEMLSLDQLMEWKADVWMMSPPCQPHTRQHSNQAEELQDPRSSSFLHVCGLLQDISEDCLPTMLFLENVVGFESSKSCERWRQVLAGRGFHVGHFHLNPTQVGLPNDRPRYYTVAIHDKFIDKTDDANLNRLRAYLDPPKPPSSKNHLAPETPTIHKALELEASEAEHTEDLPKIEAFLDEDSDTEVLRVPDRLLQRDAAWCLDVVSPLNQRSSCFTSSYGKFARGTGSVLYQDSSKAITLLSPEDRQYDANWSEGLNLHALRYFSGYEMARLFGFPARFVFPTNLTMRQQWKLMGNSLNVRIAARLIALGLSLWRRVRVQVRERQI